MEVVLRLCGGAGEGGEGGNAGEGLGQQALSVLVERGGVLRVGTASGGSVTGRLLAINGESVVDDNGGGDSETALFARLVAADVVSLTLRPAAAAAAAKRRSPLSGRHAIVYTTITETGPLGIRVAPASLSRRSGSDGLVIVDIKPTSAASKTLQLADVLVAVNGQSLCSLTCSQAEALLISLSGGPRRIVCLREQGVRDEEQVGGGEGGGDGSENNHPNPACDSDWPQLKRRYLARTSAKGLIVNGSCIDERTSAVPPVLTALASARASSSSITTTTTTTTTRTTTGAADTSDPISRSRVDDAYATVMRSIRARAVLRG